MRITTLFVALLSATLASADLDLGLPTGPGLAARHAQKAGRMLEVRSKTYKAGHLTFYWGSQLNNPACGGPTPKDDSMIVAVPESSPAKCGDTVQIHWKGKTVEAKVVDYCGGCGKYDIDTTKGVFSQLATLDEGLLQGIHWRVSHKKQ